MILFVLFQVSIHKYCIWIYIKTFFLFKTEQSRAFKGSTCNKMRQTQDSHRTLDPLCIKNISVARDNCNKTLCTDTILVRQWLTWLKNFMLCNVIYSIKINLYKRPSAYFHPKPNFLNFSPLSITQRSPTREGEG